MSKKRIIPRKNVNAFLKLNHELYLPQNYILATNKKDLTMQENVK